MGIFGAIGKAMKAPLRPINRAVGAIPGMGAVQRATPGMGAMAKNTGIGIQPQGQGVGPSNPMLSKFGMLGQKLGMNQPPQMGAAMGVPDYIDRQASEGAMFGGSQPATSGYQAPMDNSQTQSEASYAGPPAPPTEAPMNQGLAPSPRMMPRRPMMRPQFQRGRM